MVKNSLQENIIKLGDVISGEEQLKKKKAETEKKKKKAKEKQDSLIRSKIEGKNLKLEIDEDATPISSNKIVQNIKLFEWVAPRRSEIMFDMKAFLMIVALALVFMLYLAILGNIGLMGVIIALLFLVYVAGTRKPLKVKHRITARGIDTPISVDEAELNSGSDPMITTKDSNYKKDDSPLDKKEDSEDKRDYVQSETKTSKEDLFTSKLYEWYMLEDFCFYKKYDQHYLIVRTQLRLPSKLIMLVEKEDIETIFMLLQDKLLYRDVRKENMITKLVDGEYVSLEDI